MLDKYFFSYSFNFWRSTSLVGYLLYKCFRSSQVIITYAITPSLWRCIVLTCSCIVLNILVVFFLPFSHFVVVIPYFIRLVIFFGLRVEISLQFDGISFAFQRLYMSKQIWKANKKKTKTLSMYHFMWIRRRTYVA